MVFSYKGSIKVYIGKPSKQNTQVNNIVEHIVVVVVLFIVIPKKEVAFVNQLLSQQGSIE